MGGGGAQHRGDSLICPLPPALRPKAAPPWLAVGSTHLGLRAGEGSLLHSEQQQHQTKVGKRGPGKS